MSVESNVNVNPMIEMLLRSIFPAQRVIVTSGYGYRKWDNKFHSGLDLTFYEAYGYPHKRKRGRMVLHKGNIDKIDMLLAPDGLAGFMVTVMYRWYQQVYKLIAMHINGFAELREYIVLFEGGIPKFITTGASSGAHIHFAILDGQGKFVIPHTSLIMRNGELERPIQLFKL
jgi:hypothetical protein